MRSQFLNWGIVVVLGAWFITILVGAGYLIPIALTVVYGIGVYNTYQKEYSILRNFPVVGYLRYIFEGVAPEMQQYFAEGNVDGKPFSKNERFSVYKRAKNISAQVSFGTQLDLNNKAYDGLKHSMYAKLPRETLPTTIVGGKDCTQKYKASLFNVAAMSFGSMSGRAISALNIGAKDGDFYQNTGEGGISQYHLEGGDLCWQIGAAYFGCKDKYGNFSYELFAEKSAHPHVKMIEIKLSQGSEPGHGATLPAAKNTLEVAKMRHVEPGTTIHSPAMHSAFSNNEELLKFIKELRDLSNGKPIGIKLCVGDAKEFEELCHEMINLNIYPDFITIDGAEGGSGSGPLDFSDYVGMPLRNALQVINAILKECNIRDEMKIIACGKIIKPIDVLRTLSMGADICNSARGFMFALGCIQAMRCHTNRCPVGITTQNKMLIKGLDISDKSERVFYYHRNTLLACNELLAATGKSIYSELSPELFYDGANFECNKTKINNSI